MVGGVLLDVDGVLTVSWRALPGAVETIGWLRERALDFRLVTNTSSKSRRQISALLDDAEMPVDADRIVTAVSSAARRLTEEFADRPCLVVNDGDLSEDLPGVPIVGVDRADRAEVVLLGGAGPKVGYADLNAVFRLAGDGMPVIGPGAVVGGASPGAGVPHRRSHVSAAVGTTADGAVAGGAGGGADLLRRG